MASPEFVAVCCLKGDGRSPNYHQEDIFTGKIFNSICLGSSSISLVGIMILLISQRHYDESLFPGINFQQLHPRNEVIKWLTAADILACIGFFMRSSLWLAGLDPFMSEKSPKLQYHHSNARHVICVTTAVWIELFCISSYLWNFIYGLDVFLTTHERSRIKWLWHIIGWFVSALMTSMGLLSIYYPSLETCGGSSSYQRNIMNYIAYFLPICLVIICNPIFFYFTAKRVKFIVARHGRYSAVEQQIVWNAKVKFIFIMTVFIGCWFPNIINAILDADGSNPKINDAMWALWVMKAIMNPLQALFNCLVFRGWPHYECNSCPWRLLRKPQGERTANSSSSSTHINSSIRIGNRESTEYDSLLHFDRSLSGRYH